MKSQTIICHWIEDSYYGCKECGHYGSDSKKPCYVEIPDHIPDKQIQKFLRIIRRDNV